MVRELLEGEAPVEIESGKIEELLGYSVSVQKIQQLLSEQSDNGSIHCRLVDVIDTHQWTLRFWRDRNILNREDALGDPQNPLRAA